jgi:ABC-2 type transport system ATP-binding protein
MGTRSRTLGGSFAAPARRGIRVRARAAAAGPAGRRGTPAPGMRGARDARTGIERFHDRMETTVVEPTAAAGDTHPADPRAAIRLEGLTKDYGAHRALDGVDLTVEKGELFGFLGPNGAGKTTTLRILVDLIRPSAGRAAILGRDCQRDAVAARGLVGYLPGDVAFDRRLRGRDLVETIAAMRPKPPDPRWIRELCDRLDLDLGVRTGTLSKGNRQKLALTLALLDRPPVLLLDEPTTGLDPVRQHAVLDLLREEAARGATVLFSSHAMHEVERLCDRVGVLRAGRLIAIEPVERLLERQLLRLDIRFADSPGPEELATTGARELARRDDLVSVEVAGPPDALLKLLARHRVLGLHAEQPGLDEVILKLYGREVDA